MNEIVLRGFACPFGITIDLGGGICERINRTAFQAQCQFDLPCTLKLDSHDRSATDIANTTDATLVLFATAYGLAFEAKIKDAGSIAWEITAREYDKASVHYSVRDVEFDADGVECVVAAEVDHIAITAEAAFGAYTAVWFADRPLDTSNDRIVNMAARWAEGFEAYRAAKTSNISKKLRKPRVAATPEAVAREQQYQMKLKAFGGHPHHGARLTSAPAPAKGEKRETTMSIVLDCLSDIADRLIAVEQKVRAMEAKDGQ